MKKKNISFATFLILFLAVFFTAVFFISENRFINDNLQRVIECAKSEMVSQIIEKPVYLEDFSKTREDLIFSKSDFLEANLSEMRVYFYRAGVLERGFPILVKGDPQDWGGSASGLYRVMSGNKDSYSIVAEVYMPYALHYYGKYYIHGEPYYPSGGKRYTVATGGCIQVSDSDAETIFNLVEINMPFLVVDKENDSYQYSARKKGKFPEISAKSYLVADLDSGFVFSEKDSKEKWPVASLAKLMTATVVAENVDLRKSIQITSPMLQGYGSTEGLTIGQSFRVVELFYPLLIQSSNDAAQALSYFLGREKTVKLMNEKANAILMENTTFVGPDGFSSENVSTGIDLFYLTRYILNNRPPLWEITKNDDVQAFGQIRFQNLKNKNIFFENPDFIGGKTGYLTASGNNGIFIFRFPQDASERRVAIILLGSSKLEEESTGLKDDVEKIIEWLKQNYFKQS